MALGLLVFDIDDRSSENETRGLAAVSACQPLALTISGGKPEQLRSGEGRILREVVEVTIRRAPLHPTGSLERVIGDWSIFNHRWCCVSLFHAVLVMVVYVRT